MNYLKLFLSMYLIYVLDFRLFHFIFLFDVYSEIRKVSYKYIFMLIQAWVVKIQIQHIHFKSNNISLIFLLLI